MNSRLAPLSAAIALTSTLLASHSFADSSIEGRITDEQSRNSYTEAVVRIEELNREVLSGTAGRFRLPQLKSGEYTLTVKVGGQEVERRTITIKDDETKVIDIVLNQSEQPIEELLVIGQAAQMQRALDRQRYADNTISVINADAIGQLPDANAAEALQRVPGLSIERDQGEGRFVRIRGISANLNSVSVNGTQIPAPEAGSRAVALDVIPSNLLSSLVVTKTLTPDMDANAIGGAVEINSISALDREGEFYSANVQMGYDQQTKQSNPAYGLSGGNTVMFGDNRRLGVAAAVSFDDRKFGSDNIETGGAWDYEDEAKLEEAEMREYSIERQRLGAALNFDYEHDLNNTFFLHNLYSKFSDDEQRQAATIEFSDPIAAGEMADAEVVRELKDRKETQEIMSSTFGATHYIDAWTVEYKLAYSKASEDEPDTIAGAAFEGLDDFNDLTFSNTRHPKIYGPSNLYDASQYELTEIERTKSYTEDKQTMAQLDITKDFNLSDTAAFVKFGIKTKIREKSQDSDTWVYKDLSEDSSLSMSDFASGEPDYSLGRFGPGVSKDKVRAYMNTLDRDSAFDEEDSTLEDYAVDEDINAGYIMGRLDANRLRLLAGVRYEQTKLSSKGNALNSADELITVQRNNEYSHILPSAQLRYQLGDSTLARAAWTNAVVRPTFEEIRPNFTDDGTEAEFGNPDLKALEAQNFDLGIEHYMDSSSLSAYLFYKEIDNFIYQTDVAGSPAYSAYDEVITFRNGDKANLIGIELAASHKFESLPAPFNGLLIAANAAVSESDAEISSYVDGDIVKRDIQLPNQSDVTGNFILGYENEKLSMRIAANYKSEYLLEVGNISNKSADIYQSSQTQIDFNATYELLNNLKVNFEVANITDEPYYAYVNKEQYNAQYEDYGPTYRLGFTYSSF
jgi:TonB-dependent receptor